MSRDRSTAALLLLAATATLGCDSGAARADGAAPAAGADSVVYASAAEADAMAPPPAADLLRRAEAAERAAMAALPPGDGHDLVVGACITCHSATMFAQQHKDSAGWTKTVTQMVAWGAPVPAAQQPVLVSYLTEHYPARAPGPAAKPVP